MDDLDRTRFIDTEAKEIEVLRYIRKCVQLLRKRAKADDTEAGAVAEEGMKLLEKYDGL
jgi:hypothetical protein